MIEQLAADMVRITCDECGAAFLTTGIVADGCNHPIQPEDIKRSLDIKRWTALRDGEHFCAACVLRRNAPASTEGGGS